MIDAVEGTFCEQSYEGGSCIVIIVQLRYYHKSMVGAFDKHLLADLLPERSDCVHTVQVSPSAARPLERTGDCLSTASTRGSTLWGLGLRVQLQACGGPEDWGTALSCRPAEVLSWRLRGAIARPDATALRTRLGDRARSLLVASAAPVLADKSSS